MLLLSSGDLGFTIVGVATSAVILFATVALVVLTKRG